MARTSRKTSAVQNVTAEPKPSNIYPTAIYARLSVENSGKAETKDVITNQVEICKSYIAECPYLDLQSVYIDNGVTGTVFDRPQFNRLMDDIRSGKIKCLVVRDLSRFGRDYIETGTYIERIFPQIGLRFISVKERYDSFDIDETKEALLIPLQNMINSLYSKDISRKVSTTLKAKMQDGTFTKRNLPYGYMWNEDRTVVIVDEVTAPYVKLIFQWKIEGLSVPMILKRLEEMNAPNSEARKRENGTRTGDGDKCEGWYPSTVYGMLTNHHYVGDTVLGRSRVALYKGEKSHMVKDKDEWFVFPDTHTPIISREDFETVGQILRTASETRQSKMDKSAKQREKLIDLFKGKIFCADCNKRMYYHRKKVDKSKSGAWYAFYECSTSVIKRYEHCSPHYTRQDKLEPQVLTAIQTQVKVALDYEKLIEKLRDSEGERSIRDGHNALVTSLNLKLNGIQKKRTRLYTDFAEGILTEEEYLFAKQSFDEEYETLTLRLEEATLRRTRFNDAMSSKNKWINLMKSVGRAKKLTQSLVDEAIERINIYDNGTIELVMKYADIYALTVASVKEVQEVAA